MALFKHCSFRVLRHPSVVRRNNNNNNNSNAIVSPFSQWMYEQQQQQQQQQFSAATAATATPPKVALKFYVPRSERSPTNTIFAFDTFFKDRLVKARYSDPPRDLNFTQTRWGQHKHPWRKFRHLFTLFDSSEFKRMIFPELTSTATIAAGLVYYNEVVVAANEAASQITLDGSAMVGATTAIGLLAGFRLNTSYGRYVEGRKFWGEVNNASRDLAGNALMWFQTQAQKDRMLKLIKAFPIALHWHLNEKGGHYRMIRKTTTADEFQDQKYAEFYAELHEVYQDSSHPDFVQFSNAYEQGGHVPLAITANMRVLIAENNNGGDPRHNIMMDEQVSRLVGALGMCERVLRTPVPTCFTRHASRILFIWSNLLPFAMYPALGPFGTVPASILVSYAVLGIGDVGVQLEEPFNVLPLRQYSEGVFDGVNSIEANYKIGAASGISAPAQ